MSAPQLVSVIIPVYNEARYVAEVVERVLRASLPGCLRREIIVVNDGSSDGTERALAAFVTVPEVRIINLTVNHGKGAAIRRGIEAAAGEIILLQDADLEYDPSDHDALLRPMLGGVEIVYGSRFRGRIVGMRWPNRVANHALRLAVRLLYGVPLTDEATAYKVFRADVLRGMTFRARRFEWCPEVTAKCLRAGYRIVEVPIHYRARSVPEGKKIRWWDLFHALWTLVRYRVAD